jgi:peptidoglycan/LPS O-acetylase OafA/YrhL
LQTSYRLGYRSDIEGLRAVAILLVVAAHAHLSHLAGGFVGVDVFFVLSGYLITGLLVQEIDVHGRLDFRMFYARRLRRLLPGLLLMLLGASIFGRLLLAPDQQMDQAGAAAGAALWLSNFVFAFGNLDYFGASADSNLFLHTWSLGVEEQFYLVWPLLLVLIAGAWRGKGNVRQPAKAIAVMLAVLALSLTLCSFWMRQQPLFAFYMMPARAWQFALGAIVFLLFGSPASRTALAPGGNSPVFVAAFRAGGWIGLVAIVAAATIINGKTPYPGVWALCPSLGAAAVLASGAHAPANAVGRLLSLRPLQSIGRVSYAWYLWHWPVLLLGATLLDMHSPFNRVALGAASLIIGAISYHWMERSVRSNPALLRRPGVAIAAAVALMILGNALALRWHNAARDRMASAEQQRYEQARSDAPIIYFEGCDDWYFSDAVKFCAFGAADAPHTAIAIGDSVALQWFPAYEQLFVKPGWRLLVATKSSCPMVDVPIYYPRIGREFSECDRWRGALLAQIAGIKPDVVVFGSTYTTAFTQTQWIEGTTRVLKAIAPSSGRVFIMRGTPVLAFDGPSCLEPRSWLYKMLQHGQTCESPAHNEESDAVFRWLQEATRRFANVGTIDMTNAICPDGVCSAERNGVIVFRDFQHLTASYAHMLAPALEAQMAAAFHPPTPSPGTASLAPQAP